jgi:RNA polymerase sigma-70 factor (ECF subfamily)
MQSANEGMDELLDRAARGDALAKDALLQCYRDRLLRMIAVRLDRRLAARVDASDVVQEALLDAALRLPEYLMDRPIPFYPWLRRLAWEHLLKEQERHLEAHKRSVAREVRLPDESGEALARHFAATGTSPSQEMVRKETLAAVQGALLELPEIDREVLVLRYLEQLSTAETAAVLQLSEAAVKMRHRRALERLSQHLAISPEGTAHDTA